MEHDRLLSASERINSGDSQGGLFQLQKLVQEGDASAALVLAHCHLHGIRGIPKNVPKAIELYEQLAKESEPLAFEGLGRMYLFGIGVEQDYGRAFQYYSTLANVGEARSQFVLGNMYSQGLHDAKDNDAAYAWFTSAAEGGNLYAARNVAVMSLMRGNLFRGFAGMFYWTVRILFLRVFNSNSEHLLRN